LFAPILDGQTLLKADRYIYRDVTSIGPWSGKFDGKEFNEVVVMIDTWRNTNGRWQVVSRTSHAEPIETSSGKQSG
jgi:hypothetical protein